ERFAFSPLYRLVPRRFRFAPASPLFLRVASDTSHQLARSSPVMLPFGYIGARLRASGSHSLRCTHAPIQKSKASGPNESMRRA
ncbi:MAG: hypothetical protein ACN4GZ_10655, partial [Acidimicrobiales bacterium]